MRKRTIVLLTLVILLFLAVCGTYVGIGLYYQDHFFEKTAVNGLNVSDLTAKEAEALLASRVEDYRIEVVTREGSTEVIEGVDIGYRFVSGGEMEGFLKQQNLLAWLPACLGTGSAYEIETSAVYDEVLLQEAADRLFCMQEENITKPQDARVEQQEGQYVVVAAVEGNEPDAGKVYEALKQAVSRSAETVNLEESDCYRSPSVYEDDGALKAEAAVMNQYSSLTVTYQMGGGVTVDLDSDTISGWFSLDEHKQPVFDRDAVAAWVNQLADTYDTIGTWPEFVTSNGETVWPEARTYGWQMDRESETEALYQMLLAGESGERSPVYLESAYTRGANDIGDTYIEIDYTNQRMWYYKDGVLLAETPVVTGNTSLGMGSPEGIFCIVGKQRDAVLKGEDYETPVSYWMPFYGGVGIHDADSWRGTYGGTIYQYGGSHGCINTPTAQAAVIFENVEIGTPVVCYSSSVNYGYGEISVSGGSTGQTVSEDTQNTQENGKDTSGAQDSQDDSGEVPDIVILDGGGSGVTVDNGSVTEAPFEIVTEDSIVVMPDNTGQQ